MLYFASTFLSLQLTRAGFCNLIDRDTLLNEIMTSIEDLVSDQSQHVRGALATQVSGLAPILGKEEYVNCRAITCRKKDSEADKRWQNHLSPSTNVPTNVER